MHRVRFNLQTWATTQRLHRLTQPAILVSSAVVGASIANSFAQPIHCQQNDMADPSSHYHRQHHHEQQQYDPLQEGPGSRRRSALRNSSSGARVDRDEDLVPAVLYIASAGVLGSFLARKSNFVVRFLSPIALALGAAAYTVPKTTNHVLIGLKQYDYRLIGRQAEHKARHVRDSCVSAKNAVVGVAEGTASFVMGGLATAEDKAKEAAHDLGEKTHKLQDQAHHALDDLKDQSTKAAHKLKDKTQDVAHDWKAKAQEATSKAQETASSLKDEAGDKAAKAKDWVQTNVVDDLQRQLPKDAEAFKRSAESAGHQAKDWVQRHTPDTDQLQDPSQWRRKGREVRDEMERGFDRFRRRAQQGYDQSRQAMEGARDDIEDTYFGRRASRRDLRDRWADAREKAEDWAETGRDWAQDAQREGRRWAREGKDKAEDKLQEGRRWAREGKDKAEDKLQEGRRFFRDEWDRFEPRAREEGTFSGGGSSGGWGDQYRHHSYYDGPNFESRGRSYGFSSNDNDDDGNNNTGSMPRRRRSVSEMAREQGRSVWHKHPADPYESSVPDSPRSPSRPWWNTHTSSPSPSSQDQAYSGRDAAEDSFQRAKGNFKRNAEALQSGVDQKMQEGRRWWQERTKDVERGIDRAEEYGGKLGDRVRGYFEDQDRDPGAMGDMDMGDHQRYRKGGDVHLHHHHSYPLGMGGQQHIHGGAVFSDDNWFHYEPSPNLRRGERGL